MLDDQEHWQKSEAAAIGSALPTNGPAGINGLNYVPLSPLNNLNDEPMFPGNLFLSYQYLYSRVKTLLRKGFNIVRGCGVCCIYLYLYLIFRVAFQCCPHG